IAIDIISKRLRKSGIKEGIDFKIHGEPKDVYSAKKLSEKDSFQFQIWCNSRLDATPSQTKTADKGVDGIIYFIDPSKSSKIGKGIIQVKGTKNINPSMVRDLKGTLKSQNADFGILITFKNPTQGMINEATIAGYFKYANTNIKIPKIQFLTVEDLFKDPIPAKLPGASAVFPAHRKPIIKKKKSEQLKIQ
ncbi:MAG: restriction endonuclease, partial [Actinobacteria bacterium]|nr:restriction endonuclease [Actinomycetota bacterium]